MGLVEEIVHECAGGQWPGDAGQMEPQAAIAEGYLHLAYTIGGEIVLTLNPVPLPDGWA